MELTAIVILVIILALGLVTVSLFTRFMAVSRENKQRFDAILSELSGLKRSGAATPAPSIREEPEEEEEPEE